MTDRDQMPPGYYWGTEQPPPDDADTADRVEVRVTYGVSVQEADGMWRWSGTGLNDKGWAEEHAATYRGIHSPVPAHRKVIEVTRTHYVWGDPEPAPADRVCTAEKHVVLSEHRYTGPSDPWA